MYFKAGKQKLGTILLIWLAIIMIIAVLVSSAVGFILQDHYQKRQAFSMIRDYLDRNIKKIDVDERINSYFDEWMDDVVDPEGASRKEEYHGEYMKDYSWAELSNARLFFKS